MSHIREFIRAGVAMTLLSLAACSSQRTFSSPEEAAVSLAAAVRSQDRAEVRKIFGPRSEELRSDDPAQDRDDMLRFARALETRHAVRLDADDTATLLVGDEAWPFSVPLVRHESAWRFDTDAGIEELNLRRIGRNELKTIQACRTLIDAQRDYFSTDRDGDGVLEYASKLLSTPGRKDGLYWDAGPGGLDPSPIGPAFAQAASRIDVAGERLPFHGYRYRVLTGRSTLPEGDALRYEDDDGNPTRGWAAIAYPDEYAVSGVMSFLASDGGEVYERDLGPETSALAESMEVFEPNGWSRVGDGDHAAVGTADR